MTLLELIRNIEQTALEQPAVSMVVVNDVFRLNAVKNAKYGVFAWTQGNHSANVANDLIKYSFTLFFVDRLLNDKSNETEIQSTGIGVLHNILLRLDAEGIGVNGESYTTFNQRFTDECAGVFCNVSFDVPFDVCEYDYREQASYLLTSAGEYFLSKYGEKIIIQ